MTRREAFRGAAAAALAAFVVAGASHPARASSHREAPGTSQNPAYDNTDTYLFVSPTNPDAVTLVGCWWPAEEPSAGPNWFHFDDNIAYRFHVDNDGDAVEEIVYELRFTTQFRNPNTFLYATGPLTSLDDPDWNFRQTYTLTRIDGESGVGSRTVVGSDLYVPPVNIGPRTIADYESLVSGAFYTLGDGVKVFAGQRDDPFYVDLGAVFDLLGFRVIPGNQGEGVDGLGGYNCQAIVLEVPIAMLTRDGSNPSDPGAAAAVLGMWATSARKRTAEAAPLDGAPGPVPGLFQQVSRLGMPLVNEVVIPLGKKDLFNRSRPGLDGQFLAHVLHPELAATIEALYGVTVPHGDRCDLVAAFLTGIPGLNQPPGVVPGEMIRLNVAIKPDDVPDSRFGVLGGDLDGFPNGRRLADDVVDIEERVVAGVLYGAFCDPSFEPHALAGSLGDGVDQNDMPFLAEFPYLSTPHQGWEHDHHRVEPPHDPQRIDPSVAAGALHMTAGRPRVSPTGAGAASSASAATPRFALGFAHPNPAIAGADIAFSLPREMPVTLKLYDVSGREVRTLVDGTLTAGAHSTRWDGADDRGQRVAPGLYLAKLVAPGEQAVGKIAILR